MMDAFFEALGSLFGFINMIVFDCLFGDKPQKKQMVKKVDVEMKYIPFTPRDRFKK